MRIGIVNDMLLAREALRRAVVSANLHEVAWLARDGVEAVAMALADRPDLILMDLIMPGVDGVEATRRIMAQSPCHILVVTSALSHHDRVYEAMSLGALDAVDTPGMGPGGEVAGASSLLEKIATIAKLNGRAGSVLPARLTPRAHPGAGSPSWPLVAIGASTGGPAAVAEVLAGLPNTRDSAVVIIQHVDMAFADGIARMLSDRAGRAVDLARGGERPMPGKVLLAATNDHLALDSSGRLYYSVDPKEMHYRPSVDVFFASAAEHWAEPGAAVVLTGMGRDGAAGLMALRNAGWLTIAQDEATSVVYGMPRAAAETKAAQMILPLPAIAGAIADRVRDRSYQIPGASRR